MVFTHDSTNTNIMYYHTNLHWTRVKTKFYRNSFTGAVGASPSASTVTAVDSHTANLPLWSQFCCRLAATSQSTELDGIQGVLYLQVVYSIHYYTGRYFSRVRITLYIHWTSHILFLWMLVCFMDAQHVVSLNGEPSSKYNYIF